MLPEFTNVVVVPASMNSWQVNQPEVSVLGPGCEPAADDAVDEAVSERRKR
jgi:hypothetical protein